MPLNYKPYEQQQLDALLPALKAGMDPMLALQQFQGIQGGAVDRRAQQQAYQQAMMDQASQELRGQAAAGMTQGGAMDIVDSYQAQAPGLENGKYQGRLEDLVRGGLYEGGNGAGAQQVSDTYVPDPGAVGGDQIDPESVADLAASATMAAQNQIAIRAGQAAPEPTVPSSLHDLRMRQMLIARNSGYSEAQLDQLYDLLGQAFAAAGGDPGEAPMNTLEQLSAPAMGMQTPPGMAMGPMGTAAPPSSTPTAFGPGPVPQTMSPDMADLAIYQRH